VSHLHRRLVQPTPANSGMYGILMVIGSSSSSYVRIRTSSDTDGTSCESNRTHPVLNFAPTALTHRRASAGCEGTHLGSHVELQHASHHRAVHLVSRVGVCDVRGVARCRQHHLHADVPPQPPLSSLQLSPQLWLAPQPRNDARGCGGLTWPNLPSLSTMRSQSASPSARTIKPCIASSHVSLGCHMCGATQTREHPRAPTGVRRARRRGRDTRRARLQHTPSQTPPPQAHQSAVAGDGRSAPHPTVLLATPRELHCNVAPGSTRLLNC
jgi:hypothetical protein